MVGTEVVADDFLMAFKTGGGSSAGAHCHEILGDVLCENPVDIDEAEELLEVGCDLERGVEEAETRVDRAATVERRMGRHESEAHLPSAERSGGVAADGSRRVGRVDIMDIAVDGIELPDLAVDGREDIRRGVEIVGVEQPDHISSRHHHPLVHRIIYPVVRLGDPPEPSVVARFEFADNVEGVVLRATVDDYVLKILVILSEYTLHSVTKGRTAVPGSGDDGDFHLSV